MRKKIIGAILILGLSAILLTGCAGNPNITHNSGSELGGEIYTYVDPDTGVNYVIFSSYNKGGICPRYDTDGSIIVTKDK